MGRKYHKIQIHNSCYQIKIIFIDDSTSGTLAYKVKTLENKTTTGKMSNFTSSNVSFNAWNICKFGYVVIFDASLSLSNIDGWKDCGTIASDYRPKLTTQGVITDAWCNATIMKIYTNGTISIYGNAKMNTNCHFNMTWVTNY